MLSFCATPCGNKAYNADMMKTPSSSKFFALQLALLVATTPLAVDAYLPAMPSMATFYNSDTQQVAVSVSLFLIGFALGQLVGGPSSDRIGRRPLVLMGLSGYILASVGIAFSNSVEQLWALRLLQAFSGGAATVTVGAMVRDRFDGQESAKVLSMVALIMMSAPLLAPGIGSLLLSYLNWQSIFIFLALYASFILLLCQQSLPETRAASLETKSWADIARDYARILSHRHAMAYIISLSFAFSTMFVFITESAYLYIDHFAISSSHFPFLFGANIVTMMLCNRINIGLLKRYQPQQIIWLGVSLQCAAALSFALLVLSHNYQLYSVVPLIMLSVGSLGLIAANASSATLSFFPNSSGTANAVLGTSEFLLAGLIGTGISALPHNNLLPISLGMAFCALCSLSSLLLLKPKTA